MRRIVTCAAVLLFVVACGSVYAKGGNGGGRPATAGAQAKGPKTTKAPKTTTTATNTARGKSSAPGQVKKAPTPTVDGGTVVSPVATGPNVPKNPKLQARLQAKLPGMTLDEAAANFKNQGQFIAAVHAADRLGVDFAEFKAKMVDEGNSLGQTIQFFKPGADAEAEASLAESKAKQDLK